MRRKLTKTTLEQFMREFALAARTPGKVYFTGGATALLPRFCETTHELAIKLHPEPKGAFEAIATLKTQLDLNAEPLSPDDFIPGLSDWRERSAPLVRGGYTTTTELKARFSQIEPDLLRYPSIDAGELNRKFNEFLADVE